MRVALAVACLFLSGCLQPSPGPPEPGPATGSDAHTYSWGISDCAFVIVAVPVERERLAPFLPEGFRPAPTRLSPLPAGPRASIELDAYRCRTGVGLDGTLDDLAYGSYYVAVEVPPSLHVTGHEAYFVKFDVLVPDAPRRTQWQDVGLPARAGDARVAVAGPTVFASLDLAGAGGFRLTGTVGAAEPLVRPLPFMEYTPLGAGSLARWRARLHDADIAEGAGTVEILPGSWVADLVGATRVPATFIAGTWNLDEANVTLPIAWPL